MAFIDRRSMLIGSAALFGCAAKPPPADKEKAANTEPDAVSVPDARPAPDGLHARAKARGMFFGTAIDQAMLVTDAPYMTQVVRECGMLVSEYSMKWGTMRPGPRSYNFGPGDKLIGFARKHGMQVRGHTLAWHEDNPQWLSKELKPRNAERILTSHVREVVKHFAGQLVHWDVVNEVLEPKDGKPGGLRDSLWYRALGDRFIDIAFHACAETDPTALRCINDYGLDYAYPEEERKRGAMLDLLQSLKRRNVPVQALGIQGHIAAGELPFDPKILETFINNVTSMGLKVLITEMDVRDRNQPADIATRDEAVASAGGAYLEAVLQNPNVIGVLSWGLSDRRTWLNKELPRQDHLPERALPLDTELQRKRLWSSMGAAIDSTFRRA